LYDALSKSSDYEGATGFLGGAEDLAVQQRRKLPRDAIMAGVQAISEGRLTQKQASFYLEKGMYSRLREAPTGLYQTKEEQFRASETKSKFTTAEEATDKDYRRIQELKLQRWKEAHPALSTFIPDMAVMAFQNPASGFDLQVDGVSPDVSMPSPSGSAQPSGVRSGAFTTQSPRGSGNAPVEALNNTMKALINRIDTLSRPPVDAGKQR
jgi:hypothetical protein